MVTLLAFLLTGNSFVACFRAVGAGGFKAFLLLDIIIQIVKVVSLLHNLTQSILAFMVGCSEILFSHGVVIFSNPCWVKLTMLPCSVMN